MLNGVAGGRTARGHPDLAIDRAQVGIDDTRADDQLFSNLGVGQSLGQQMQDLDFTRGSGHRDRWLQALLVESMMVLLGVTERVFLVPERRMLVRASWLVLRPTR